MTQSQPSPPRTLLVRYSEAIVPTEYGPYRVVVYREADTGDEHCAFVRGEVRGSTDLLVRVHSECFTGEVLHSLKCDCREQLDQALRRIADDSEGAVLYLRQEGRGIGLGNKIRAYALQAEGIDTVDANLRLGFEADARRYTIAAEMLRDLGVQSIALLTNNPEKVQALREDGVVVSKRLPMNIEPNAHNRGYLDTKVQRMGHLIDLL
ncbi:MAG: GTP cyclohydrolase II [Myxococcales bacterium]|nr:GTP cyclohydrolase II [Myxococcales bacterium]MDD9971421.1 GTP cyclohydrolase II [Myxococcales bacterium]